jgi:serine acetyltransferase
VFGGINVGDQAQIATHSMLRDDLPAGMLAAGAPAIVKGKNPAAVNQE